MDHTSRRLWTPLMWMSLTVRRATRLLERISAPLTERLGTAESRFYRAKSQNLRRLQMAGTRNPIVVYTMGKVASSSISQALRARLPRRRVFHVHSLIREELEATEALHLAGAIAHSGMPLERVYRKASVWTWQYVADVIAEREYEEKKTDFITAVRDPVARNISAFFQNISLYLEYDVTSKLKIALKRKF